MSTTFPRLLLEHAAKRPHAPALREKEYGIWQTLSWSQIAHLVRELAAGLAQAGLKRGQHIVIVGANRPRLSASMLAAQSLGAIPVPLYQDAAAAEYVNLLDYEAVHGKEGGTYYGDEGDVTALRVDLDQIPLARDLRAGRASPWRPLHRLA